MHLSALKTDEIWSDCITFTHTEKSNVNIVLEQDLSLNAVCTYQKNFVLLLQDCMKRPSFPNKIVSVQLILRRCRHKHYD